MAYVSRISSKGQMVIPAQIRKKYRLDGGSQVAIDERDGVILLMPNPVNPFDAILALRGVMSKIEEDVEGWWMEEKRREREREDWNVVDGARLDERRRCSRRDEVEIGEQLLVQADDALLLSLIHI